MLGAMDTQKLIDHWINSAEDDIKTVEALWESRRYHHCLFFCHLVVEKALKAHVVRATGEQALPTHDLLLLAKKAGLEPSVQRRKELSEINSFNVRARYESYKREFYKKATRGYTQQWYNISMEVFKWLKEQL
jgi:HEPN domain-containing protein